MDSAAFGSPGYIPPEQLSGKRVTAQSDLFALGAVLFEALTGERQMDASAIADYFAPLKAWLDEQNKGRPSGW